MYEYVYFGLWRFWIIAMHVYEIMAKYVYVFIWN